ncbi:MAG: hypothetical protein CM1200mP2_43300 [Planctomycetaceae bacterium]|nr:MAG: hypothetical protein CM1200mP2_43300 [Planctomycetaceae bacterium]
MQEQVPKDAKCREANAHKANHQLAATGPATLKKCVSGWKIEPGDQDQGQRRHDLLLLQHVQGQGSRKPRTKLGLAFSDKAFAKGYVVAKKK